jgi:hypothetical protein
MGERLKCVRFEIEYDDGQIIRLSGEAAERHLAALEAACIDVHIHGRPIPKAEFVEVRAAGSPPGGGTTA